MARGEIPLKPFRPYTLGSVVEWTIPLDGVEDESKSALLKGELRMNNIPTFVQMERGYNDNERVVDAVQTVPDAEKPKVPVVMLKVRQQFTLQKDLLCNLFQMRRVLLLSATSSLLMTISSRGMVPCSFFSKA